MTQVCMVRGKLLEAQDEVLRAPVGASQDARERFYDAAANYDESHGDDESVPTCRICAEASGASNERFRAWVLGQLSESPTAAELVGFAHQWEEIANSYGDPVRYVEAGVIWSMAAEAQQGAPDSGGALCGVCGEVFTAEQWRDRHTPHAEGCGYEDDNECYFGCGSNVHFRCCKDC